MAQYLRSTVQFNSSRIVKIISTDTVDNYTVYVIELSLGAYRWRVTHRYSEFHELHEKLSSKYKIDKNLLPPKKLFGNQSESFIRKRQGELELYLQVLLQKLHTVPDELSSFLHFDIYEIHGITQGLAEELFHKGDLILQSQEDFQFSPLQLNALTIRLKLAEPTCESGDPKKDIGHVLDFVTRVKKIKITGQLDQLGTSNILINDLNYDLNMFKALQELEISFCKADKISAIDTIKQTVRKLKVFQTVNQIKDLLLADEGVGQWLGADQEAVLVPVWVKLTTANFSYNRLKDIDQSVKLMPKVERLDLSHNRLTAVDHLDTLAGLTHLDLSYNAISTLDSLHTRLGNVKSLCLANNKLQSLQGFSKLYSLESLDVSNNEISQVLDVQTISTLPCLEHLTLSGNPVVIIVDYRNKIFELFKERAKEVFLDGVRATQKELDTVAVLLAIQKSREVRNRASKHGLKPRDAHISDPGGNTSSRSSSPAVIYSDNSSRGYSPTPGPSQPIRAQPALSSSPRVVSHSLTSTESVAEEATTLDTVLPNTADNPAGSVDTRRTGLGKQRSRVSVRSGDAWLTLLNQSEPVPSLSAPCTSHQATPKDNQGSAAVRSPDLIVRPKEKPPPVPNLGYQFTIQQEQDPPVPDTLPPVTATILPETLPSRNDTTFMSHLQDLLPNTSSLTRASRTRDPRRGEQEERAVHIMWSTAVCYTQPFRELMTCICITTENVHILEVKDLRSGANGMPRLLHKYCIPLLNIQQIVLGHERQYLRVEEAFVGPQGTYTLLTGSMAKTDLFLDSLKLAYRRAVSDIDQYEDPHILCNPDTIVNLMKTLNSVEQKDLLEDSTIDIVLYMLVKAVDYSRSSKPFMTHSLVMTSGYLYLLQEDYILWPQATFAIGYPSRTQFVLSCVFPIGGKISGIQMYDSDTYSPDQDTSLSQTFSATKTCAMVVPNFIGYGVKLVFDMGELGHQTLDIRVPTSGLRDKFLATLTQLRRVLSERQPSPAKHSRNRGLPKDADSDSTNSSSSLNHAARPKYHKHKQSKGKGQHTRSSGARPDLLPDIKPVEKTLEEIAKRTSRVPYEHKSTESSKSGRTDSAPDESDTNLSAREAPTGESDSLEESSSEEDEEETVKMSTAAEHPAEVHNEVSTEMADVDKKEGSSSSDDGSVKVYESAKEDIENESDIADDLKSTEPDLGSVPEITQDSHPSLSAMSGLSLTPQEQPSIVHQDFSFDGGSGCQYPSMALLSHLTECNGDVQLTRPLSDTMRNLSIMEGDEIINFFHHSVAQISQNSEELRHVLWSPVVAYIKPSFEVISCIMLSTKAVYFVSDVEPVKSRLAPKDFHTHHRNKSDSFRFLAKQSTGPDIHLSSPGVIHKHKQSATDFLKVPKSYAVIQLKDIKQVTMGLFDQSFRIVGASADSTYICMTRDNKLTDKFTRSLMSLFAVVLPAPSPDLPSGDLDSEQDFYSMFNNYQRNDSHEVKQTNKVKFVYPSEDVINELLFVYSDSVKDKNVEDEYHLLAYIMVFSLKNSDTDGASSSSVDKFMPRTLMVTERHLALGEEDHIHYPIPDFAYGPPATPRYRIYNMMCLDKLKRVVLDAADARILTLVFQKEIDIVVNAEFDHYTNYGGRVPHHIRPSPEVCFRLSIPNVLFKEKLLNVLRKQWKEIHDETELTVVTNEESQ